MDHRNHGEDEDSVPAETIDGVAELCEEVGPQERRSDEKDKEEAGDDESRKTELLQTSLEFILEIVV